MLPEGALTFVWSFILILLVCSVLLHCMSAWVTVPTLPHYCPQQKPNISFIHWLARQC